MMNRNRIIAALLAALLVCLCVPSLAEESAHVEYVDLLRLDMNTDTAKQEVTVKTYVDGDTTHFFVPEDMVEGGVLKARYLAINTPESTGRIEEYGKAASKFTREKLESAASIIIESETNEWNLDSTGGRYLVWVWYRTDEMQDYRNLNLEILQNGLSLVSGTSMNQYGEICQAAVDQARAEKLNLFSGQKDPGFYYGEAVELTLRELRCHPEKYDGIKVAFNGIISMNSGSNSVYIEDYDEETGLYYGISAYYGFNMSGGGLKVLRVGNESRIVGSMQYYEAGGVYQIAGMSYRQMKKNDPNNIQLISEGHTGAFLLTSPDTFANGKVTIEEEDGDYIYDYAYLALNTSIAMEGLTVVETYATSDEASSSFGALTLLCEAGDATVTVRTVPLYDENRELVKGNAFLGKTINVKGIVDVFDGAYQIKVFRLEDIAIQE